MPEHAQLSVAGRDQLNADIVTSDSDSLWFCTQVVLYNGSSGDMPPACLLRGAARR